MTAPELPAEPRPLQILSLGAGVQSTTMALMAAHGEITPMPDCAIFADTGWEPPAVYTHLEWLQRQLPFPVHIVSAGNLRERVNRPGQFDPVPWYVESGLGRRQCTKEYKLYPIRRKVRELLGGKTPRGGCDMWIGISTDEAARMKPSSVAYICNRWPLIDARMSRWDCTLKLERLKATAPRSACEGCPFHSDEEWRDQRDNRPDSWRDTVALSRQLALTGQYMHRSLKPLDEVDLSTAEDRGQLNMFNNECEGMCGV